MTEALQTQNNTSETTTPSVDPIQSLSETVINEVKLFANKFKTVEELEKAYGNSVTAMVEKAKLEKELEKYRPPESYDLPRDISLDGNQFEELKLIAKNADMTQSQFEKTAKEMHNRVVSNKQAVEKFYSERKTSIGEEKLNLLNDYVEKYYPSYARELILDKLIKDDSAMSEALKDRDTRLNTQVPGVGQGRSGSSERYNGEKELMDAARAAEKNPRDKTLREKFVNLAREVGHARKR
jgi:GTP1/Obg family GTP-binding protein